MRVPLAELLLRLGVAFSFLYPPIAAFFDPDSWLGYFPAFIPASMTALHVFGAIEIVIALWILFGKRIWIPSAAAAAMLLAIVIFNLGQFDVLFRDVSIALMALALVWMHFPRRT
ncbi:MAG: DoxX family membrane protein [Patescibacteria group bacterium]